MVESRSLNVPLPVSLFLHRLPLHSGGQAFHVPTVLAPVPLPFVYDAVSVLPTRVRQLLPDCALEEALAALAGVHAVVLARRPVAADRAEVLAPGEGRVVCRGRPRSRGLLHLHLRRRRAVEPGRADAVQLGLQLHRAVGVERRHARLRLRL